MERLQEEYQKLLEEVIEYSKLYTQSSFKDKEILQIVKKKNKQIKDLQKKFTKK